MKILVTPRSATRNGGHASLELLRAAGHEVAMCRAGELPAEEELRALLPGCAGYIAGVEPIGPRVLEAADSLQVISRNGAGLDNIDLAAARARGIRVLRAEGANAQGVAELTVGHLFALARSIVACDRALKNGDWRRGSAGVELKGKVLGLAGCGRIGQIVAQTALALGMAVIAFDPAPDPAFQPGSGFRFAAWEEVLEHADFLSLHCPPTPDARPVLDAAAIARMKCGAFLINTARHDVLDADAALAALNAGRIAGMAVDVFDAEPPADPRLLQHPRVIATPHIGAFTRESIDRAMRTAVANLLAALEGAEL